MTLLNKLLTADVCCKDCGSRYGKYSVGCSSTWVGTCGVCGENKPVTEVRDWGYLTKGINDIKKQVKAQSLEVANYMKCQEEIASQCVDDTASYEKGEITLKLTEDEVGFLHECLDVISEHHPGVLGSDLVDTTLFEGIEKKVVDLYEDHCIKYELSPALKSYHEKYGTWGTESPEEVARWHGFRDAFTLLGQ